MHLILVVLLAACGRGPPPDGPVVPKTLELVDEDWHGLPGPTLSARTDLASPDEALKEALARGLEISESDPDLSGTWQTLTMGGKSLNEERIIRRRSAAGVYAFVSELYVYDDEKATLRAESHGTEVIGSNQLCTFIRHTEISYADEAAAKLWMNVHLLLDPNMVNEPPCRTIVSLAKREVVYDNGAGTPMVQTRQ